MHFKKCYFTFQLGLGDKRVSVFIDGNDIKKKIDIALDILMKIQNMFTYRV